MHLIQSSKKLKILFSLIFVIISIIIMVRILIYYTNIKETVLRDAQKEAHLLQNYMMSMRKVYHQQFLQSGIELNDHTLGFLPAHASSLISDEFIEKKEGGYYIRNVSDRPRNPRNLADDSEMEAIGYFRQNRQAKEYLQNKTTYIQYASPIYIESYCLACHGKREEALPSIQKNYDAAYDYKTGELRGIVSVKIPVDNIDDQIYEFVIQEIIIALIMLVLIFMAMFFLFRKVSTHVRYIEKNAEDISLKDNLTNLYNRHFLEQFGRHHEYFNSPEKMFAVAFLDIDHFKQINDTYGHDTGDEVLRQFAKTLHTLIGENEIAIRYGGEEFLVIVYNTTVDAAVKKFDEVRKRIEETTVKYAKKEINITVSIGIATGWYDDDINDVITMADKALYVAKNEGRNRLEVFYCDKD